jgi:hypothetical protein
MVSVILVSLITTLLACCLAGIAVILRWGIYQRERASLQVNHALRLHYYQRLCRATELISYSVSLLNLIACIAGSIVLFMLTPSLTSSDFSLQAGNIICFLIAPCLLIPAFLYDLLGVLFIDLPALAEFHGSQLEKPFALQLLLKSSLFGSLPHERRFKVGPTPSLWTLLLLEVAGLLLLTHHSDWLWFLPLFVALWEPGRLLLERRIVLWTTCTLPIEQSPWGALVLHIGDWARVSGVRLQDVRVHIMLRIGTGTSVLMRPFRPMLLLNNLFLLNSEWRQQEALVATLFGQLHKHMLTRLSLIRGSLSIASWTLLAALATILSLSSFPFLPLLLILSLAVLVFTIVTIYQLQGNYVTADRFAAELTRDPTAILVALHTLRHLVILSPWQALSLHRREQALGLLLQQPESQDHWNNAPVSSPLPLMRGGRSLTKPPHQAVEAEQEKTDNIIHLLDYRRSQAPKSASEDPPPDSPYPDMPSPESNT